MRSNLENRYRALLRVALPGWYRAEREEEMVGLFLADRTDDLDLEHGWPGWGEAGATVALGVRTRFAASGAPARTVALGDVVRLVALIGVLVQGAYGAQGLLSMLPVPLAEGDRLVAEVDPFTVVALVSDVAMLVGAVAMVTGFRTTAKVLFGLLSAVFLVGVGRDAGPEVVLGLLWQLPVWVTTAALLAGFHRDAPTPELKRWRWALAGSVLGAGALTAGNVLAYPYVLFALTSMLLVPVAVLVAGVVHLARRGGPVGALALGWWLVVLLPVELVYAAYSVPLVAELVAAMAVVGVALLVVGLRGLRRPATAITP